MAVAAWLSVPQPLSQCLPGAAAGPQAGRAQAALGSTAAALLQDAGFSFFSPLRECWTLMCMGCDCTERSRHFGVTEEETLLRTHHRPAVMCEGEHCGGGGVLLPGTSRGQRVPSQHLPCRTPKWGVCPGDNLCPQQCFKLAKGTWGQLFTWSAGVGTCCLVSESVGFGWDVSPHQRGKAHHHLVKVMLQAGSTCSILES